MENRLDVYTSIVPSARQAAFQEAGFHAFIHYGMNTFTGKEWGDGTTPPSTFNPTRQDTDQWVRALQSAGAQGVILTCKHHDGFCLWPTKTTEYCVRNSPYLDGKGDVVRELSDSCKKFGMKFGIYLSPWDRNSAYYGTPKYNDFYIEQLKELLTWYGDIFCVWLDGACGSYMDGKEKQVYDFPRIYQTVREYQPGACISNCGPDIRWVGNEGGYARKSEWNVVPMFAFDLQTIESNSQQADDAEFRKKGVDVVSEDLGSRELLAGFDEFIWYPAEVDVSIRPGWFYHKKEDRRVRSLNNLLQIYFTSVGGNSLLLLNVPPTREGLIHENDVRRLQELGDAVRAGVAKPVAVRAVEAAPAQEGHPVEACLTAEETCYTPAAEQKTYELVQRFDAPCVIDRVLLREQCAFSQRIEAFELYALRNGEQTLVYSGTTVGFRRFALLRKPVEADGVKLVITACRKQPYLQQMQVYCANGPLPRPAWYAPIVEAAHHWNYKRYVARENRKNNKL